MEEIYCLAESDWGGWPALTPGLLDGHPASDPEFHGAILELATLLGDSLRRLHSTDLALVPGPAGWEAVREKVRVSKVDTSELADPYRRYELSRLIELWEEARPPSDDLVVCHGTPRLDNYLVHQGRPQGWVETGRLMVADRHLDLAIAHRSVGTILGNEAVFAFYEAYGSDPHLATLEHYLLAELLTP